MVKANGYGYQYPAKVWTVLWAHCFLYRLCFRLKSCKCNFGRIVNFIYNLIERKTQSVYKDTNQMHRRIYKPRISFVCKCACGAVDRSAHFEKWALILLSVVCYNSFRLKFDFEFSSSHAHFCLAMRPWRLQVHKKKQKILCVYNVWIKSLIFVTETMSFNSCCNLSDSHFCWFFSRFALSEVLFRKLKKLVLEWRRKKTIVYVKCLIGVLTRPINEHVKCSFVFFMSRRRIASQ